MKNIEPFEHAGIRFCMCAPGYDGRSVSGDDRDSYFTCDTEHFTQGTHKVTLKKLEWYNGTSHVPVLELKGQATPDMLRALGAELESVALRMEYDSKKISELRD